MDGNDESLNSIVFLDFDTHFKLDLTITLTNSTAANVKTNLSCPPIQVHADADGAIFEHCLNSIRCPQ